MKKIYTMIAAVAVTLTAAAQRTNMPADVQPALNHHVKVVPQSQRAAAGDTVLFFDGNYVYGTGIDMTFDIQNEDIDAKTIASAISGSFGPTSAFNFFYTTTTPTGDTNFFWGAASWFNPVGVADNWLEMGPITIPAAGATLKWHHNIQDPAYRDGYKMKVSTTGMNNYSDFTSAPIFTVGDNAAATATDTAKFPYRVFYPRSYNLSAYAGQTIYIAIHHDANDMFIIWYDNIVITENAVGVTEFENGVRFAQNAPNPFKGITSISYELKNDADVTLNVYDVAGKKVAEVKEGAQTAGKHAVKLNAENLAAGVYYYSMKVGENTTSTKKMVVVK
jgi:hypothetical protein